ncbi:MAG TPA: hypothetical protein VLC46_04105 [Thermoanaerobaculia bacterium]|nr:hypothetical protein [Thermoanaerobaculia bacterium]
MRAVTTLQTFLVLAGYVALLLFVPHEWLRPLSVGFFVFAVLVVVGVRAYLRRLEMVVRYLATDHTARETALLVPLLTERERGLLRLNKHLTAAEITNVLRRRQATLTFAAMCVAIPGICAFLVAVFFFSD